MPLVALAAAFRELLRDLHQIGHFTAGARRAAEQAATSASTTGSGSAHPLLVATVTAARQSADRLAEAQSLAATASELLSEYAQLIGIRVEPRAITERDSLSPLFQFEIASRVRPRTTKQTFGIATDEAGRPLHTGELMSGHPRHAPVDPRSGVRDPRVAAETAVSMHVEGQVAALMRQSDAPTDVVLYVNNSVCRGRTGGRGCSELLPGILPAGSRLTVHFVAEGRRVETTVYEGDGSLL